MNFTGDAPVIITIVLKKPKRLTELGSRVKNKEWPLIDIGITAEHFCLQATEEGLGTCINKKKVTRFNNISMV